jgi:hypothetical protein
MPSKFKALGSIPGQQQQQQQNPNKSNKNKIE